jgi:endonuclease/exonuclease/phosphatase family metal-dependent hydrolase
MRWTFALLAAASAAASLGGCVDIADQGTPWEDAAAMTGPMAPELGPAPALRAKVGCTIRIASWNVHKLPDAGDLTARLQIPSAIEKADVILMQESSAYPGEAMSRTAQVADALKMTWAHQPVRELDDGGVQGNAIISRFPLENVAVKRLPYIEQPYHPQPRGAIAADVVVGDHRVRVVSVHLDVRTSITDRVRQLDPAVIDLDERAVIGGDFNTAPWTWIEALVPLTSSEAVIGMEQAALLDDYMKSRRFDGNIPVEETTFKAPGIGMRLDNLYSRSLPVSGSGVEHLDGSDHWPLWVDVDVCN